MVSIMFLLLWVHEVINGLDSCIDKEKTMT